MSLYQNFTWTIVHYTDQTPRNLQINHHSQQSDKMTANESKLKIDNIPEI